MSLDNRLIPRVGKRKIKGWRRCACLESDRNRCPCVQLATLGSIHKCFRTGIRVVVDGPAIIVVDRAGIYVGRNLGGQNISRRDADERVGVDAGLRDHQSVGGAWGNRSSRHRSSSGLIPGGRGASGHTIVGRCRRARDVIDHGVVACSGTAAAQTKCWAAQAGRRYC